MTCPLRGTSAHDRMRRGRGAGGGRRRRSPASRRFFSAELESATCFHAEYADGEP
jgi:hypothetical protein